MSEGIYGLLAPYYDLWNADLDYSRWADGIEEAFLKHFAGKVDAVLDLGCGSGRMTVELARRGYDMIGVDLSSEMLNIAREKAIENGVDERILWLCQPMQGFELYGTVEAVVCCLDSINHLPSLSELRECFALVHNYLVPGGLFLFDVNSPYKFKNIYGNHTYTFEDKNAVCIWQNEYSENSKSVFFDITLFTQEKNGLYRRDNDFCREKMYTERILRRELAAAGFTTLSVGDDPYTEGTTKTSERLYFAARAEKDQ